MKEYEKWNNSQDNLLIKLNKPMKIQYQLDCMIAGDVVDTIIEFTEKKAIAEAKNIMSLKMEKGGQPYKYCDRILISKLEKDNRGFYSTIEQDYITIK